MFHECTFILAISGEPLTNNYLDDFYLGLEKYLYYIQMVACEVIDRLYIIIFSNCSPRNGL